MPADSIIRVALPEDERPASELLGSCPMLIRPSYDEAVLAPTLALMTHGNPALLSAGTFYGCETSHGLMDVSEDRTRARFKFAHVTIEIEKAPLNPS